MKLALLYLVFALVASGSATHVGAENESPIGVDQSGSHHKLPANLPEDVVVPSSMEVLRQTRPN